jgi:hypothetical protein
MPHILTYGSALTWWLFAGPYTADVSSLYTNNYDVPLARYGKYFTAVEHTAKQVAGGVRESDGLLLYGQRKVWALRRLAPGENRFSVSDGGVFARLMQTFAYTEIISPDERTDQFQLLLTGSAEVWLNGEKIFSHRALGRVESTATVTVQLKAGVNRLLIALTNVHLHAANAFELVWQGQPVEVKLPLVVSGEERRFLEEWFASLYFNQGLLPAGDELVLQGAQPPSAATGKLVVRLAAKDNSRLGSSPMLQKELPASTHMLLCRAAELPRTGQYTAHFDYVLPDGEVLADVAELGCYRVNIEQPPSGVDFTARKKWLLSSNAGFAADDVAFRLREWFFIELSRLTATGGDFTALDREKFIAALDYIDARYDCADFALHGLLRFWHLYGNNPKFPADLRRRAKQTILNFKYWEDEPGSTMMFTRSENHRILFHSAEYLAGSLFPDEIFFNSGLTGQQHAAKGAKLAAEWLGEKGKFGFEEWHSNTYYEEDFLALLDLYDFASADSELRAPAKGLLDLLSFIFASHHFHGIFATTHGRVYEQSILYPEVESTRYLVWLLFGMPESLGQRCSIGAVALATSGYEPARDTVNVALDPRPLSTKSRMGLFKWNADGGVNCLANRRDEYMVAGMLQAQVGGRGVQVHAGQITLKGGVPVFVTCFDNPTPNARPSYWGGQFRNPKTIVSGDVLAYIYDIPDVSGLTHCYFPKPDFDETVAGDGWLFGRKGDAYVAVYSLRKHTTTAGGMWKDRELLCDAKQNIWLLQAGCRADYGSFEKFRAAIASAKLIIAGDNLRYAAPHNGELFFSYKETCTRDGKPVLQENFPLIDNSYGHADYGSGILRLPGDEGRF